MREALHYDQLAQLADQKTDPGFPDCGWDTFLYLQNDHPERLDAIEAALRIGYNLGLRAARGEDLLQLPRTSRPSKITLPE